jgi:hypothetical protein
MAGLVTAIHVSHLKLQEVDARHKAGPLPTRSFPVDVKASPFRRSATRYPPTLLARADEVIETPRIHLAARRGGGGAFSILPPGRAR